MLSRQVQRTSSSSSLIDTRWKYCFHDNKTTKQTRIVPLLDVVDGRLMVLPLRTPLSHASGDDAGMLAVQFLEGVAYLQSLSIAHLDLKPDNIVVQ